MQREQETVEIGYRFNGALFKTQVHNCDVNLTSFFMPDSAAGQGLKSSLRTKTNSVCRRPFSYFFVHSNMRLELYIQIILFRDMAHWRAQFFCKSACSADPARACSLCSRVSAHHGTRRQPSSRPFRPS